MSITQSLIGVFQKGVALTPKEAFYILQNNGVSTTYKSVSKILSRLYYRGILNRHNGHYFFSQEGRHSISNRETKGDITTAKNDTQKLKYIAHSPIQSVSFTRKLKRNGIRSYIIKRFMAILLNNNIQFFETKQLYNSLSTKYEFHVNRNTFRVIVYRLKKRGFLNLRYGYYYVNLVAIRKFFATDDKVSKIKAKGATTPGVLKSLVQSEISNKTGTSSPVSIRVSEHAPRVDIQIGSYLAEKIIEKYNLKPISPKDPSNKVRFKGRHFNAIITKNGYVMIVPKDSQWLNEVRDVFGEGAAAQAKLNNAMKHKEYSIKDIVKLYKSEKFGAQIDYSEFGGDIGFQGDAEKVEVADEIFRHEIINKAAGSAYLADIIVDMDRTTKELKELLKNTKEEVMAQVLFNSQAVSAIRESAKEITSAIRQFIDIIENTQNRFSKEVEGYA